MTLLSLALFQVLIVGALVLTGLGALLLVVLLIIDQKKKQVW